MRAEIEGYTIVKTYPNGGFMEVPDFMAGRLEKREEVVVPDRRSEIFKHEITEQEMDALNSA